MVVDGATSPFWLVLGQSWSTGWTATANGQPLGTPVPVNGYGNAWYVDPAVVGTGPIDLRLAWAPQRIVWIAIGLSVLGGALCLVLMVRRPRRRREPEALPAEPTRPLVPDLVPPRQEAGGDPPGRRTALLAAGAVGLFAVLNLPFTPVGVPLISVDLPSFIYPLLALPLAGATYAALRARRSHGVLGLAGAASLALAASYIVGRQALRHLASNFTWPIEFSRVHILGLAAVFLLGADALAELLRRRRTG
jgi:hypothetical protein